MADPQVYSGGSYKGPVTLNFTATSGQLMILIHGKEWGSHTTMAAPSGGASSWTLESQNAYTSNNPMHKQWYGTVTTSGSQIVTVASTSEDAWIHAHLYLFDVGATVVDGVSSQGVTSASVVAPTVAGALIGDWLVCSALKSYHGGAVNFTPPVSMTGKWIETDPTAEYSTMGTGWETLAAEGATGTRTFVATFDSPAWASSSIVVRPPVAEAETVTVVDRWNGTTLVRQEVHRWVGS